MSRFLRALVVAVLLSVCVAARADTCAGLCSPLTYDVDLKVGTGSIQSRCRSPIRMDPLATSCRGI
jgi:hypothetical protein